MKTVKKRWEIVLESAKALEKAKFTAADILRLARAMYPNVPESSLRTFIIAMAPNHPSSHHYPSTRKNHPHLYYLGDGWFKLADNLPPPPPIPDRKGEFLEQYGAVISGWTDTHLEAVLKGRRDYTWKNEDPVASLNRRNTVQADIVASRIRNQGGVDLETLDKVMEWGGFPPFPLRAEKQVIDATREAFRLIDEGSFIDGVMVLLGIPGVGISTASKIVGLFDQNRFAVYDSRVGNALRSLVVDGERLVKCPASRLASRPGDTGTDREWARNYERCLWILETIRDNLLRSGYCANVSDVEMGLFMMGK